MTESALKEIDRQLATGWHFKPGPVPALLAEVRRLRALVKKVEWGGDAGDSGDDETCPWCYQHKPGTLYPPNEGHKPDCPAFGAQA